MGATSYGVDCTSGNSAPGVYADVFNYMQWIKDVLSGKEDSTSGESKPSVGSGNGNGVSQGDFLKPMHKTKPKLPYILALWNGLPADNLKYDGKQTGLKM